MIVLLAGLALLALFVSLVMLFGARPRRVRPWPGARLVREPRSDNIEIFRDMLRRAEIADRQRDTPAGPPTGHSSE